MSDYKKYLGEKVNTPKGEGEAFESALGFISVFVEEEIHYFQLKDVEFIKNESYA